MNSELHEPATATGVRSIRIDDFTFYRGRVAQAALLRALGIGKGDEVAVQAFTCSAVAEGVLSTGARPVYIDVEPGSGTMDAADLAARLTPATRAVIVQHTYGIPADMDRITAVTEPLGLPILEDCAHAIDSTLHQQLVGTFGVAAFYSFEASKPIFAGIGGGARVNSPELRDKLAAMMPGYVAPSSLKQGRIAAMYAAHRIAYRPSTFWTVRALYRRAIRLGLLPSAYHKVEVDDTRPVEEFGWTLGGLQHRRVRQELAMIEARSRHRRQVAASYRQAIPASSAIPLSEPAGADTVFGRYPLRCPAKAELLRRAPEARVELSDWYATPIHPLTGVGLEAAGYRAGSCPNAERLTQEIISLPTGPLVDDAQLQRTAALFRSL